ncbi:MAG: ABC transporter permease [Prolixibacteraceae bacterium]|nr:ABC transporter permease [Prolixibacteraceae bacterium]
MNFPLFIAKRYLVSKKKRNIVNIISGIALSGVTIGTIALVVVLSVYNGFNDLIHSMFNSFDPDLKITAVEGKTFEVETINQKEIEDLHGVAYLAQVLQERAILEYASSRDVVTVKGVSPNYKYVTDLDSLLIDGNTDLIQDGVPFAVIGAGISYTFMIRLNFLDPMHIYAAKKGERVSPNLARSLNHKQIYPTGIFSVQDAYDSEYLIVPLNFARDLFDIPTKVSALEIKLKNEADKEQIQKQIQTLVGEKFHVKNKYQQQELVYKVMNSEKWAIFFILVFIFILLSFNIIGSISMLIIDKKDDIAILQSMGAGQKTINRAFLLQGWLITFIGAVLGLILGILISLAQQYFEIIKLPGGGSFAVSAYPVSINPRHLILSFLTVILIGFITSWLPIKYFSKKYTAAVQL